MVRHIAFWTLRESALGRSAEENALEMKSRLEALNGKMPGLLHLEVGLDPLRTPASADLALYSEFPDRTALDGYRTHPEHVAVVEFIDQVRETRMIADYEVDTSSAPA